MSHLIRVFIILELCIFPQVALASDAAALFEGVKKDRELFTLESAFDESLYYGYEEFETFDKKLEHLHKTKSKLLETRLIKPMFEKLDKKFGGLNFLSEIKGLDFFSRVTSLVEALAKAPFLKEDIELIQKDLSKLISDENKEILPLEKKLLQRYDELKKKQKKKIIANLIKLRSKLKPNERQEAIEFITESLDFGVELQSFDIDLEHDSGEDVTRKREALLASLFPSLYQSDITRAHEQAQVLDSEYLSKRTKEQLAGVVEDIVLNITNRHSQNLFCGLDLSHLSYWAAGEDNKNSINKLRSNFIFIGDIGVGKSVAANAIARALGSPFYKVNLSSPKDINDDHMFGAPSFTGRENKGQIPQAFLKRNAQGKTAKNPVILLEDLHLALKSDNALRFLTQLFDPQNDEIDARYFGIEGLDFSNAIIIATMNPLNENISFGLEKRRDQIPEIYQPLVDRAKFVFFEEPPIEQQIMAARKDPNFYKILAQSSHYRSNKFHWDELIRMAVDFVFKRASKTDPRERKRRIAELLKKEKSQWEEQLKLWGRRPLEDNNEKTFLELEVMLNSVLSKPDHDKLDRLIFELSKAEAIEKNDDKLLATMHTDYCWGFHNRFRNMEIFYHALEQVMKGE